MATQLSEPAWPLFPLQTVLFPGGLLNLKVFEARYLDLVATCMREQRPFAVVALRKGSEVRGGKVQVEFESTGVLAELLDVDSSQPGILNVRCRGTSRFVLVSSQQRDDGLWLAEISALPTEAVMRPLPALRDTVQGLANAIATLEAQGTSPFLQPYELDNAGWVANRWCEILPIPLGAKQKLMELSDPSIRLRLVDEFLRSKGVVN
ncbi:MAG: LON peptidase substrate-binding domain-containing protein [Burkholderiaceae bacterium]